MKHLLMVRHAKSSWSDWSLQDIDRPLNQRGKKDAPFMADFIHTHFPEVDLLLISPAKRAQLTAQPFKSNNPNAEIQTVSKIYDASVRELEEVVMEVDEKYNKVMMFGHNPAYTYMANKYTDEPIDNVPTCGIVVIQFDGNKWSDFDTTNAKVTNFYYPKQFKK